jgi:DNA-binding GntR family transcriptional regulator
VAEKLIERAMGARYYQDRDLKLKSAVYENGKKVSEEERVEAGCENRDADKACERLAAHIEISGKHTLGLRPMR